MQSMFFFMRRDSFPFALGTESSQRLKMSVTELFRYQNQGGFDSQKAANVPMYGYVEVITVEINIRLAANPTMTNKQRPAIERSQFLLRLQLPLLHGKQQRHEGVSR